MTKYLTPSKLKYYDTTYFEPKLTTLESRFSAIEQRLQKLETELSGVDADLTRIVNKIGGMV